MNTMNKNTTHKHKHKHKHKHTSTTHQVVALLPDGGARAGGQLALVEDAQNLKLCCVFS